jgi:hypothetical protein
MPSFCRHTRIRQLTIAATIGVLLLLAWPAAAQASYGPPPPAPPPVPGGFSQVVTSQTIGPKADCIRHLRLDGYNGSLCIRRHTFLRQVQLTVTEPFVRDSPALDAYDGRNHRTCGPGIGIGDAGFPGYCAFTGAGILVQINGVDDGNRFRKAMILRIYWRPRLSTIAVVWDGSRFVRARHASDRPHSVRIRVRRNADFAVLMRVHRAVALTTARQDRAGAGWRQALSTSGASLLP